jgi:hypothetical protein
MYCVCVCSIQKKTVPSVQVKKSHALVNQKQAFILGSMVYMVAVTKGLLIPGSRKCGGAVTSTGGAVTSTGGAVCKGATPLVEQ